MCLKQMKGVYTMSILKQISDIGGYALGVPNFHFGIGVWPEGPQMGLKERIGIKNRVLKNWFFWKK